MATMKPLRDGKRTLVSWYDGSGVRRRVRLPNKEAKDLYEKVCASRLFEIVGINPQFGKHASNYRSMRFKELADQYREYLLTTRAEKNVSYVDILVYKWGEHVLSQIRKEDFRTWIKFSLEHPIKTNSGLVSLAASSILKVIKYAVAIFNYGIENSLINQNPLTKVIDKKLRKDLKRLFNNMPGKMYLTEEEFWGFVNSEYVSANLRDILIVIWCTGMRESEACKIKWSMIDGNKIVFTADEVKEIDAKTVVMEKEAFDVIARIEADQLCKGNRNEYVFLTEKSLPFTTTQLIKLFRNTSNQYAAEKGNEKFLKITLHRLRDSYTTRKINEGHDPKVVGSNLGHHSLNTTNIYNIVDESRKMELAGFRVLEELEKPIVDLLEIAKKHDISLADLQAEIRCLWREKVRR